MPGKGKARERRKGTGLKTRHYLDARVGGGTDAWLPVRGKSWAEETPEQERRKTRERRKSTGLKTRHYLGAEIEAARRVS